MAKSRTAVNIQIDRKYEGLGVLAYIESPLLGLATNLEDTKREPFHALEIFALPDLKYGWVSVPQSISTSLTSLNHNQITSPVNYLVGWSASVLYIYNLETQNIIYQRTLDGSISAAIFMDDITVSCLVPEATNPLKVIFYTTNTLKEYTRNGNCLAFFKTRLFVGEGKILHFSGPAIIDPNFTGNPFDTSNGGGYLLLNYPQVSKICYLLPYEDMLYIFTDGGLYVLTVSLASNAPSTFYIIDTGINFDFSKAKILQIGNSIVVITNIGMFSLSGMSLERFDWIIADQLSLLDFQKAGSGYYQGQALIFIPYINENKTLGYSREYNHFFFLPFKTSNCIFTQTGKTYDFSQANLQLLFANSIYYPFSYLSVLHDYGQNRFKYIREAWINGRGNFQISYIYDNYGLYQSTFYSQIGPDLANYRKSFGRKGYKIGIQIKSDESGNFAFVNKVNLRLHLLGPINYFYYTG
jgi:hypothetical protein